MVILLLFPGHDDKFSNDVNSDMKLLQRSLSDRHPDGSQDGRNYLFDQRYGLSNNGHDMNKVSRPYDPFTSRFSHDLKQLTGKGFDLNEEKFQRMAEEFNDFRARISMAPIHHFGRKDQMMNSMVNEHHSLTDRSQQIPNRDQLPYSTPNMNTRHGDTPVNSRSYDLQVSRPNGVVMNRPNDIHPNNQYRLNMNDQDSANINRQTDESELRNNTLRLNNRDELPLNRGDSLHRPYRSQEEMLLNRQSDNMHDNVNTTNLINSQDKLMMNSRNKMNGGQDDMMMTSRSNLGGRQDDLMMGNGNNMDDLIMTGSMRQTNDQNVIGLNPQIGLNGNASSSVSPRNLLQSRQTDIDDIGISSDTPASHAHDMRINSQTPVASSNNIGIMSRSNEISLSHENLSMSSQQPLPNRHANFDQVTQNGTPRMNGVDGIEASDVPNGQMNFGGSDDIKRLSNGSQNGDSNMIRQRKRKPSNPQHVFMPSIDHYTGFPTEDMEECGGLIIDVENGAGYENKMASRVDMREPMNCN